MQYDPEVLEAIQEKPLAVGHLHRPVMEAWSNDRTRGMLSLKACFPCSCIRSYLSSVVTCDCLLLYKPRSVLAGRYGTFIEALVSDWSVTRIQEFHNQYGASLDGTECQEISYRLNGIAKIPIVNAPLIIQLSPDDWELIRDCLYDRACRIKKECTPNALVDQVNNSLSTMPSWRRVDRRKNIHALKDRTSFMQRLKQRIRTRGGASENFKLSSINLIAINRAERKVLAIIWDRMTCLEQLKLNSNGYRSYNETAEINLSERSAQSERLGECTVIPVAWWRPEWNNLQDLEDDDIKFSLSIDLPDNVTWDNEDGVIEFGVLEGIELDL